MATSIGGDIEDNDFQEAHEINVTPFIDVMLVLLIIFMVAATLSTVDLPVDLPSSTATPITKPDKPIYITIKSDLALALGDTPFGAQILYKRWMRRPRCPRIAAFSCGLIARCPTAS